MGTCLLQVYSYLLSKIGSSYSYPLAEKVWRLKSFPELIRHGRPTSVETFESIPIFKSLANLDTINVVLNRKVSFYSRIVLRGVPFTVSSYRSTCTDKRKIDCYFFSTQAGAFGRIERIISTEDLNNNNYYVVYKLLRIVESSDNLTSIPSNLFELPYLKRYYESHEHAVLPVEDISRKCISLGSPGGINYVGYEQNSHEGA